MDGAVELPRVLDIKTFVQARDTEVAILIKSLKEHQGYAKYGASALSRHLRRRATSHQRYLHIRRPNVRLARALLKRRREEEQADVTAATSISGGVAAGKDGRPTNRAMRRRPARLVQSAVNSCAPVLLVGTAGGAEDGTERDGMHVDDGPAGPPSTSTDQTAGIKSHRLETHSWHARRMRMHAGLWGHTLALQAAGRGRGSRSLLHQLRTRAITHDASYWGSLQLSGHQRDIARLLEAVSNPAVLAHQLQHAEVHCGAAEWDLTLHTPHCFPAGTLAPVKLLWVPLPPAGSPQGTEAAADREGWYTSCLLWVWVHAAGFQDVAAALDAARQGVGHVPVAEAHGGSGARGGGQQELHSADLGLVSSSGAVSITCVSSRLRRLELMGGDADAIIQQVIKVAGSGSVSHRLWRSMAAHLPSAQPSTKHAVAANQLNGPALMSAAPAVAGSSRSAGNTPAATAPAEKAGRALPLPYGCVIGVTCEDPRLEDITAGSSSQTGGAQDSILSLDGVLAAVRRWPESGDWTYGAHELLRHAASPAGVASALSPLPRPCSEAQVGQMRTGARRRALHLPTAAAAGPAPARPLSQLSSPRLGLYGGAVVPSQQGGATGQEPVAPQTSDSSSTQCPVLLVRRQHGQLPGWSIILPSGWVMPFWLKLAFTGARPAGQLEWRWAATQAGASCYPWDWPHTPAGARLRSQLAYEFAALADKRPLGKAPKAPGLPYIPWQRVGTEAVAAQGQPYTPPGVSTGHQPRKRQQQGQGALKIEVHDSSGSCPATWQVLCSKERLRAQLQGGTGTSSSSRSSGGSTTQVWAWVAVTGKGRCEEGAEIAVEIPGDPSAASLPASAEDVGPSRHLVLGYVLRGTPRGIKPAGAWGASALHGTVYPGGLALCDAASLLAAAHSQRRAAQQQLSLIQQLKRAGHAGGAHDAAGLPGLQPVRVQLRNPGSDKPRNATLIMALAAPSDLHATMPCL